MFSSPLPPMPVYLVLQARCLCYPHVLEGEAQVRRYILIGSHWHRKSCQEIQLCLSLFCSVSMDLWVWHDQVVITRPKRGCVPTSCGSVFLESYNFTSGVAVVYSHYKKLLILYLSQQGHKPPTIAKILKEEGVRASRRKRYMQLGTKRL